MTHDFRYRIHSALGRSYRMTAAACIFLAASATAAAPVRAEPPLSVELNKLEQRDGACRAYLVILNGTKDAFDALKLDLVLFGSDGVIATRLALDAAPLAAGKTAVKPFDISGIECAAIGRVLLNDILSCASTAGARDDCVALIVTSSRASAPFVK